MRRQPPMRATRRPRHLRRPLPQPRPAFAADAHRRDELLWAPVLAASRLANRRTVEQARLYWGFRHFQSVEPDLVSTV